MCPKIVNLKKNNDFFVIVNLTIFTVKFNVKLTLKKR
jgi:hypothetical protein